MGPSELWTGQGFSSLMTFIKFILRLGGVGHHLYRGPEVSTSYSAAYWSLTWLRDSAQESQQLDLWHPNTSKLCKGEAAWLRTGLECLRVGDVFVHGDWCLCVFVPSIQLVSIGLQRLFYSNVGATPMTCFVFHGVATLLGMKWHE